MENFVYNIDFKEENFEQIAYRGSASIEYKLEPSIFRNDRENHEAKYYHEMERFAPNAFEKQSLFDKLCKMQHYSLCTRLLDLTANPLVALFFACNSCNADEQKSDGKVEAVRGSFYYSGAPEIQYLSALPDYRQANLTLKYTYEGLIEHLRIKGIYVPELDSLDVVSNIIKSKCIGIIPNNTNERLRVQQGLFLLFGQNQDVKVNSLGTDEILNAVSIEQYKCVSCRIPSKDKPKILSELKQVGIHKATLMPELEKIGEYVVALAEKKT